ncbi:MAG: FAD-dependent thymidylate synthase [Candidatus Binatia bacterium]|nr:FAD-dependent thymidylate synthase [Candidatus Binatia bacterium]
MSSQNDCVFTSSERAALAPYFTNLDAPVFALRNLPEVVKGALFARYSRSPKSVRRLFLDEFLDEVEAGEIGEVGVERAERLYERVFDEYGDDSVAQLGGVHLACEGVSNIVTKVLEWGRLMAYLEQSTRYIAYDTQVNGRWRYVIPPELEAHPLRSEYERTLDMLFATYGEWLPKIEDHFRQVIPPEPGEAEPVYRRSIRAKALDTLRGLLPAATQANVGLFGSGQAFEALLLRMRSHPLGEARKVAELILQELRKVIPAFLRRVDRKDRGEIWSAYLRATREATREVTRRLTSSIAPEPRPEVTLTEFDPDGEVKVVAAAMYPHTNLPDDQLLAMVRRMTAADREAVLRAYVGERRNRRHKPGRAFERTSYRFDVLTDYGAFRDLQRHRMLTIEWQPFSPEHGYGTPTAIIEAGAQDAWERALEQSRALYHKLQRADLEEVAPYALCFAYRIRFYLHMNAREAMHILELRTSPQGHPVYRRVCQEMHRLIADQAGHRALAATMQFVSHEDVKLERLQAERRREERRRQHDSFAP